MQGPRRPRSHSARRHQQVTKRREAVTISDVEAEKGEELADTVLAAAAMEETEDYLVRGRRFERLTVETLRQRWIAAFKAWCRDRNLQLQREFDDAAAVLRLRGEEPPLETVQDEIAALRSEIARDSRDEKAWEDIRARVRGLLFRRGPTH
jgi:hypothetical protein